MVRRFLSNIGERRMRLLFLASAVQVGPRQLPRVDALLGEACEVLDVERPAGPEAGGAQARSGTPRAPYPAMSLATLSRSRSIPFFRVQTSARGTSVISSHTIPTI